MLEFSEKDDRLSFFAPDYVEAKMNDYDYPPKALALILKEGKAEPVIMGRWVKRKSGGSFPQPYLAFLTPRAEEAKAEKTPAKKLKKGEKAKRVFTRK